MNAAHFSNAHKKNNNSNGENTSFHIEQKKILSEKHQKNYKTARIDLKNVFCKNEKKNSFIFELI